MRGDFRLHQLLGAGNSLNMIGVSVGGDQHLASGQIEVHLANQIDNLVDGVKIADVDQEKLAAAVDQVDVDPEPPTGL